MRATKKEGEYWEILRKKEREDGIKRAMEKVKENRKKY